MVDTNKIEELKKRIAALESAGVAADAEKNELLKLLSETPATTTTTGGPGPAPSPATDGEYIEYNIPVNEDSFNKGGQQFVAPKEAGIYNADLVEIITPSNDSDQRWLIFTSRDPKWPQGRGSLVTANLSKPPDASGGAWKFKDVLDALKVKYTLAGGNLAFRLPKKLPCKVDFQSVTIKGKTELRIQNALPETAQPAI